MSTLRHLLLVRHGETDGESSIRFHGSGDVPLSDEGRAQMQQLARKLDLSREYFDLVVASSLRRAWEAAWLVAGGSPVRLEPGFCEIDFGRWEGLTREEIQAQDPVLYQDWQTRAAGFEFPGGEAREAFRARVLQGLERLEHSGASSVLVVAHKGTIRTIAERLLGEPLVDGEPPLSGAVELSRAPDGRWHLGRRSSDPEGIEAA